LPALHVYGTLDPYMTQDNVGCLRSMQNSKVVAMKDAHHPAYKDDPAFFNAVLAGWLSDLKWKEIAH
jgi:hypothetical protein